MDWRRHDGALALVENSGGPFNAGGYRCAWAEAGLGWSDVSFGARAPDGTQAAIALLRRGMIAQSLPLGYGGVVSSRPLDSRALNAFLRAARTSARVRDLQARSVPISDADGAGAPGRTVATTSVLYLAPGVPAGAHFSKKAAQTIARARRAGGSVRPASADPGPFLRLYLDASRRWPTQYPKHVLVYLAAAGLLKLYYVELDGAIEASAAALVGGRHWMYWLAAQSTAGRTAELGYLALAELIEDAQASGAAAVNLGASSGLPGVAQFKKRFGGVDVPVIEHRLTTLPFRAVRTVLHAGTFLRLRHTERRIAPPE